LVNSETAGRRPVRTGEKENWMAVSDRRRKPYCYQEVDALAAIRAHECNVQLAYMIAVYTCLTEIANEERNRSEFRATRKAIADRAGASVKTVDRVVAELEEINLLHVDRRPGEESVWVLTDPDDARGGDSEGATSESPLPAESPQPDPSESPPTSKGQTEEVGIGDRKPPDNRPSRVKASAWNEFWEAAAGHLPFGADLVAEKPDEPLTVTAPRGVAIDAIEGLGQTHKADGKVVTPRELAIAAVAVATFNRCFEYDGKKGSDYGLLANLTQVVMRIRERPSWDAGAHVRLVESAWRIRWWERSANSRRPTPNVIWSPKSFEQVVQDATAEKDAKDKGQKPTDGGRRFTRRLKDE
jgi:hypothetical protein